jgi:hypothetical protein
VFQLLEAAAVLEQQQLSFKSEIHSFSTSLSKQRLLFTGCVVGVGICCLQNFGKLRIHFVSCAVC